MWRRADPKKDFVLSIAFALQRGNANTLKASQPHFITTRGAL
jgi:hypothetical protein